MTPDARRLLGALLERTGARMDDLERRFAALEKIAFEIDALEARIAQLEQRPPTPLGGRELQRRRVEAVLRYPRDGFSLTAIERATGVSRATVRRVLVRQAIRPRRACARQEAGRIRRIRRAMVPGASFAELGRAQARSVQAATYAQASMSGDADRAHLRRLAFWRRAAVEGGRWL